MADVVGRRLSGHLVGIRSNEIAAMVGDDPEGVHLMRVAVRRMRSDLRLFRHLLPQPSTDALRSDLGALGTRLGAVRDADVLAAVLTDRIGSIPPGDREAVGELLPRLVRQRRSARRRLLDTLGSDRYIALLTSLDSLAEHSVAGPAGRRRARSTLPPLAHRSWRRLRLAAEALDPGTDDVVALHHLRILTKRARYAVDACGSVGLAGSDKLGRRLADLQDHLGDLHDVVVAAAWLRQAASLQSDPAVTYAAGELAMVLWSDRARLTGTWHDRWSRVEQVRRRPWSA